MAIPDISFTFTENKFSKRLLPKNNQGFLFPNSYYVNLLAMFTNELTHHDDIINIHYEITSDAYFTNALYYPMVRLQENGVVVDVTPLTGDGFGKITTQDNDGTHTEDFTTKSFDITRNMGYTSNFRISIDTNLPIILTVDYEDEHINYDEYYRYNPSNELYNITDEVIENIINYSDVETLPDNIQEFFIFNAYAPMTFDGFGNRTNVGSWVNAYERFEMFDGDRACLLRNPSTNEMEIKYKGSIFASHFNNFGSDGNYIDYNGVLYYAAPFYYLHNGQINGTFYCATLCRRSSNLPIFDTQEDVNKYLNGEIDDSTSIDPPGGGDSTIVIGDEVPETEFGENTIRNSFTSQYALTKGQVDNISNLLLTTDGNLLNDIKKGLEMWGSNPVDAIVDLSYYPFDVSLISTTTSVDTINFGSYSHNLGSSISKLLYNNGYLNCGSVKISPSYKDFRDFEPYTQCSIYLPMVGVVPFDLSKYMNKILSIRYYVDLRTRTGVCCLLSDGKLIESHSCSIGVAIPISSINFSDYANNTLNALLGSANSIVNGGGSGYGVGTSIGSNIGNSIVSGIGGGIGAIGGATLSGIKPVFDLLQQPKPKDLIKTQGKFSSGCGVFLPQEIYLIITRFDNIEPTNLISMFGKPTRASGNIENFSGYLKCENVKINNNGMTEKEEAEIKKLLLDGVYI